MSFSTCHHRIPRARIDPINTADEALAMITLAMARPRRNETIALLLDESRRGLGVVIVSDTDRPEAVLDVADCLLDPGAHQGRLGGIVIASVRHPSQPDERATGVDLWLEMSDLADSAGIELIEWFVIGHRIMCPRDLLAEPPRW